MNKESLLHFFNSLKPLQRIVIQTHDFPDHDAVSSAYGLAVLLQTQGIEPLIVYNGDIDRISLTNMIEKLDIPIFHIKQTNLNVNDCIITVDGCIGEKNMTDMPGSEIAVIDHHTVNKPNYLWFCDIRPDYGAAATIIYEYYQLLDIKIPKTVATALLIGLNIDTANLTRGFCQADLRAFIAFNQLADLQLVNSICRNDIIKSELAHFEAICKAVQQPISGVATVLLKNSCGKNLLGVLADFLLSVDEFDIVIIALQHHQGIQLSLRSECPKINVGKLLKETLNNKQRGFGGGHKHMAGGIIMQDKINDFIDDEKAHFSPFLNFIQKARETELSL